MPYRTFVDSTGAEWQVWDVVPRLSERRLSERTERRVELRPIAFADRRAEPRRNTDTRRAVLRGSYAQGWLCFESDSAKRRLSPIPSDWTTCNEAALEAYARKGERASGSRPAVTFDDDEPFAETG